MKNITVLVLLILFISFDNSFTQWKRTGVDIKAGIQSPVFNFDNLYNTGYGFLFGGLFPFNKDLQFAIYSGYLSWGFDNEALNRRNSNQYYKDFDITAPIKIIPLTFGIKYFASSTKVKPYLSAEFGFFYFWQITNGSYNWINPATGSPEQYYIYDQKRSGFRTMLTLGGGILAPLSKKIDFDFQIKLNSLYNAQAISGTNNSGQFDNPSSTLYYISFLIGLNYYFED